MGKDQMDGGDCFAYLFHGLPILTVYFGEPSGCSIATEIFRRDMSADLTALDLPQQKQLAVDLYPVMVKRYDLVFGQDLDAEGLFDFLAAHESEIAYRYETAYCSPAMYSRLFKELARRARLTDGLAAEQGGSQECWFPIAAGNELRVVHFGLGRLSGKTAVS